MTFSIRAAERADADGITEVQVASWRTGYAHVFPDSVLYADDFERTRRTFWTSWRFSPGHRLAVVTEPLGTDSDCTTGGPSGERIVGFSSYGPERERARGFTGRAELYAFYFRPDTWGTGAASELMEYTEDRFRAEGFETAVLWVLEDNPRARRFYEKHGWTASGITAAFDAYCEVAVPEVEYRKELT
jgi:ribosomal protein S18 acetylase RimI-like enzyme